jgi:tRNA A37 threonylcarbamoyladenosine dehydratase
MSSRPRFTRAEYLQQFRSQIPVISRKAQEQLRRARVHVAGLGGIGSHIVSTSQMQESAP